MDRAAVPSAANRRRRTPRPSMMWQKTRSPLAFSSPRPLRRHARRRGAPSLGVGPRGSDHPVGPDRALVEAELDFTPDRGIHAYEFAACGNRNNLIAFDRDKAARRVARSPIDFHFIMQRRLT